MQFQLLGGLAVVDGGREIDLGPRMQRAVLSVLLLEAGRVVPADRLVELLWEDDNPKAMASLQAYVSRLRATLEPSRGPREPATLLVSRAPGYKLDLDRNRVDVFHVRTLVEQAHERLRSGDDAGAAQLFDDALRGGDGDLLPEFADRPFVRAEIERHQATRLSAVEGLAEARLALGDHHGAIALLQPVVDDQPLRERLCTLFALALYRAGRQADALRAIDRCRRALVDAAGLDLGPELRTLESDLLDHAPRLAWQQAPHPTRQATASDATSTPAAGAAIGAGAGEASAERDHDDDHHHHRGLLVGRDHELTPVLERVRTLGAGCGGVVVVSGEPGIGKTRFVEEVTTRAQAHGVVAFWARCPESGAAPPYWPVTRLVEQLVRAGVTEFGTDAFERTTERPGSDRDDRAASARFHLYRELIDALHAIGRPVLLVIDDLQWADPDSLRMLEHIAPALTATRVLLLATTRALGENAAPALVDCLGELTRTGGSLQLRLDVLDGADIAGWLRERVGRELSSEVAEVVRERTGGNPLFVKELVDLLQAEGQLDDAGAIRSARSVPPGVQFVVRRRVSRLPEPTKRLLAVAAVVGRAFDIELVAVAAGQPLVDTLDALTPAFDAGLLEDDSGAVRFSHALVADALAEEVNTARRAHIHAVAARTMATTAGPRFGTLAAEIAHHATLGMLAGTGELAVEASTWAARYAAARAADEDAARHWGDVVTALERSRPADVPARIEALIEQASALVRADQIEAAKAPTLAAIEFADIADLPDAMGRAATLFNHAHVWANEGYEIVDARVIAALERTLERIGPDDTVIRAEVLGALASELVFGEPERHREVCTAALNTARRVGDPHTLARVLIVVELPNRSSELAVRLRRSGEIIALAIEHDLPHEIAAAGHLYRAMALSESAELDAAEAELTLVRSAVDAVPGSRFRSQLYWYEAGFAIAHGRYRDVQPLLDEAVELHRRARHYDTFALQVAGWAAVGLDRGGLEALVELTSEPGSTTSYARTTAEITALCLLEIGDRDAAARVVERYGSDTPFADDWTFMLTLAAALHVRAELGDVAATTELLDRIRPFRGRWVTSGSSPLSVGLTDLAIARAEALLGATEAARTSFAAAVERCERLRTPAWLARSLVHQGRFLRDIGDTAAGTAALGAARSIAERHGLPYVLRRLDALM